MNVSTHDVFVVHFPLLTPSNLHVQIMLSQLFVVSDLVKYCLGIIVRKTGKRIIPTHLPVTGILT